MDYRLIMCLIILAWGIWIAVKRERDQARLYGKKKAEERVTESGNTKPDEGSGSHDTTKPV